MDMVAADAFVAALETDEGVVEAVGEGGADAVANREDGGAMPTMELGTAQAPERALERPANNKKGRVIGGKRRSLPRSRYTLCLLDRLRRVQNATVLVDLVNLMKKRGERKRMGGGVDASGGTALVPQGERDDDEDGVCSKGSNERRQKGAQCWEGWLLWGMAVMGVAGLVLVSARHQEFEPMLGYPGEGPSSANRKATRAQEDELRKQVQQESAVLEDVDTDDEWIDDMDNSSKSSLDTEVGAWQGDE